ncbi:hypothetical protein ACOSQ2_013261 [Xanthoceras sorbifolium]
MYFKKVRDYVNDCKYPSKYFHRQFCMRRELFLRILSDIEAFDVYFTQKNDALGRQGLSGLQKMTKKSSLGKRIKIIQSPLWARQKF